MGELLTGRKCDACYIDTFFQGQTKKGPIEFSYKSEGNDFDGEIF
jgi:hypothetical protein